jgi:hypothetical protein
MPDNNMGCPAQEVQNLVQSMAYARDRLLQGDWTPKYVQKQVDDSAAECAQMLRFFGCTEVFIYAHISPAGRALLKWGYHDRHGEVFNGTLHPTSQS